MIEVPKIRFQKRHYAEQMGVKVLPIRFQPPQAMLYQRTGLGFRI